MKRLSRLDDSIQPDKGDTPLARHQRQGKIKLPKFRNSEDQITRELNTDNSATAHDALLMETAGTTDPDLMCYLMGQVADSIRGTKDPDARTLNKAVAALAGIGPRDELEGMLAVQMIAVHHKAMEDLRRARQEGQPVQAANDCVNRATKLLRTFVAQVETLNRYRGKGQQKVTVEHVHINNGGQAIVGAVNQEGGGGGGNL